MRTSSDGDMGDGDMGDGLVGDGLAAPEVPGSRRPGIAVLPAATIIAGLAGYTATAVVARVIGPGEYAGFAVFWSALYLVVGALAGIQHEIARATRRRDAQAPVRVSRARNFGLVVAAAVFVLIVGSAFLWAGAVFPGDGWSLVLPLAVGTASYVLVASLAGSLFGVGEWRGIAALVAGDALLRLLGLGVAVLFTRDLAWLAWAVAIPFPLALGLVWLFVRRNVVGTTDTDVGYRRLAWNTARTVVAALSLGAILSGLPLLAAVTSPGVPAAEIGIAALAITIIRAPLVVVVMSFQSYLVVRFRDSGRPLLPTLAALLTAIAGAGILLGIGGALLGPAAFVLLFGEDYRISTELILVMIASSVLVGALCVVASALLARGRHVPYALGFVVAALGTVVVLLVPGAFDLRLALAALAGPALGLIVDLVALGLGSRRPAVR